MSRFADPTLTAVVVIGECQCPGTPHASAIVPGLPPGESATGDYAVVRTRLGGSAMGRIGRAELDAALGDHFASYRRTILEATLRWNLMWEDPTWDAEESTEAERPVVPAPITDASIELLDADTLRILAEAIDSHLGESPGNASAAPSRESRQARRSRTRTQSQKPGT
jgi:hypothetical protein